VANEMARELPVHPVHAVFFVVQWEKKMTDTQTSRLAERYLGLGGTRLSMIDDNRISVRQWDDEPEAASTFWKENVECLDAETRKNVILLLPAVSDEDATKDGHRH